MTLRTVLACTGVLFGCAACGFKGPLYLPKRNAAVVTHSAPKSGGKTRSETSSTERRKSKRDEPHTGTLTPP